MQSDIVSLLLHIKDNIKIVEAGNETGIILEEIESDFLEFTELIKLLLITERDKYYGFFLMNLTIKASFYDNCIAGIRLNVFPPVLVANPLLLCKYSLKEIIYIICHEIDHIVFNHPTEMVKINPTKSANIFERFNLAADASVNDQLNKELIDTKRSYLSQPKGIITSDVLKDMFNLKYINPLESYAYYYNLIKDDINNNQSNGSQSQRIYGIGLPNNDDGESQANTENKIDDQNNDDSQSKEIKPLDKNNDKKHDNSESIDELIDQKDKTVNATNVKEINDHNWEVGDDEEDAFAAVRELLNSVDSMMSNESRGLMPGYFKSELLKINKPPVLSWKKILKKYIGTISAEKRKTKIRLNRRQPERFDISGTMDEKLLKIVVAIDTSGSVSDGQISMIFNEIFAILARRKFVITIIECDAKVQRVYKVKKRSEVRSSIFGRGGTAFSPVIEYINNDKYFRDALLIFFTDGYGESDIPKPRTYRNLWVVFGNESNLSLKEPYGTTIAL